MAKENVDEMVFLLQIMLKDQNLKLCDGEWHLAELTFMKMTMAMNVDGKSITGTHDDWSDFPEQITDGSIHLGGLPK